MNVDKNTQNMLGLENAVTGKAAMEQ